MVFPFLCLVPDHPPLDSQVLGCNATSITLSWGNIPADRVHGIFVNYVVALVETYVDGQLGRNITEFTNNTFLTNITVTQSSANRIISLGSSTDTNSSSVGSYITTVERHAHTFVNLTPFTNYTFRIGGCTEAGCGVPVILKKRTSESGMFRF